MTRIRSEESEWPVTHGRPKGDQPGRIRPCGRIHVYVRTCALSSCVRRKDAREVPEARCSVIQRGVHARAYYRARAAKHHTYLPFHLRTYVLPRTCTYFHVLTVSPTYVRTYLRTYVRTHLRTVRTYRFTHVLYIPYRTHTYVRIVSPTYVRTYVSTYGTYVRTYSFSHVRTCGPCFIYVRTSLHASEPTATARGDFELAVHVDEPVDAVALPAAQIQCDVRELESESTKTCVIVQNMCRPSPSSPSPQAPPTLQMSTW